MAQDLDFFSILHILYFTLELKLYIFFQVYVNNVECKKHQYPIQKALRAVKKHAPSKYNEPPKHLNNLKCAPLNPATAKAGAAPPRNLGAELSVCCYSLRNRGQF